MADNYEKIKFINKEGNAYTWNEMCSEFTTEETHGELTDEQIGNLSDEEFVAAVKKYTGFELVEG